MASAPPPRRTAEAVIFDMDGLLLDTEGLYTQATQTIVSRYGKVFDWSIKAHMIGRPAMDSARYLVEVLELPLAPEDYLREREAILEALFPSAKAMAGAERLTAHLSSQGVPQAVATSSSRRLFQWKTQSHQAWFESFDAVVTGDDPAVARGKPAPDIFLVAAERLGVAPERCLVFEDSPAGARAGLAAAMGVVAVPDPHMDRTVYAEAHQVLDSLLAFDPHAWGLPPYSSTAESNPSA
ncbi:MAG: HAD-IA family hydrolase [Candidatus Competibacterales bacterium]